MVENSGESLEKIVISAKLWVPSISILHWQPAERRQDGGCTGYLRGERNRAGRKQEMAEAVTEGGRRFIIPAQLPRSFLTVSRKNRKRSHIEEILQPRFRLLGDVAFPIPWYQQWPRGSLMRAWIPRHCLPIVNWHHLDLIFVTSGVFSLSFGKCYQLDEQIGRIWWFIIRLIDV